MLKLWIKTNRACKSNEIKIEHLPEAEQDWSTLIGRQLTQSHARRFQILGQNSQRELKWGSSRIRRR